MRGGYGVRGRGMKQQVTPELLSLRLCFGPTIYWIQYLCFWGRNHRKGGLSCLHVMLPRLSLCWYKLPRAEHLLPFAVSWCPSLPAWLAGTYGGTLGQERANSCSSLKSCWSPEAQGKCQVQAQSNWMSCDAAKQTVKLFSSVLGKGNVSC